MSAAPVSDPAVDAGRAAPHPHLIFALGVIAAVAWGLTLLYFASGHGRSDFLGYSKGQDFINVWTAGHMVLEGRAEQVFDPKSFLAAMRALLDPSLPPHFWSYPPTALFTAVPLGLTSYGAGFVLWSAAGVLALAWAAWRLFPGRLERWMLLASPAMAINLLMGQNGCLTAALWLGGAALLPRRPATAGALFGLLTFKPQLGVLIPVFLLAGRRYRAILAACLSAAVLAAASVAAFGPGSWRAFVDLTLPTQFSSMAAWQGLYQWFVPSTFMAARLLGASSPLAFAAQAPFAVLGAVLVWRACRGQGDPLTRAALLFVATFVATPQSSAYDMIPVAAAALVLARRGRGLGDGILAAMLWAAPWTVLAFNALHTPLIPLVTAWGAIRLATLCGPAQDVRSPASPPRRPGATADGRRCARGAPTGSAERPQGWLNVTVDLAARWMSSAAALSAARARTMKSAICSGAAGRLMWRSSIAPWTQPMIMCRANFKPIGLKSPASTDFSTSATTERRQAEYIASMGAGWLLRGPGSSIRNHRS